MTRIIGGIAGSRTLASPAKVTRPTSDRIRESIFNRLEALNLIVGADVLDLYAGTGGLGLEAASRGCRSVVLVENNKQALGGIISNQRMLKAALQKEDLDCDIKPEGKSVANYLSTFSGLFNLVFIDPPYELANQEVSMNLAALVAHLKENAVVILERSSRTPAPVFPEGLALTDEKPFGDTVIYWLQK